MAPQYTTFPIFANVVYSDRFGGLIWPPEYHRDPQHWPVPADDVDDPRPAHSHPKGGRQTGGIIL